MMSLMRAARRSCLGCRYARRPCFDFAESKHIDGRRSWKEVIVSTRNWSKWLSTESSLSLRNVADIKRIKRDIISKPVYLKSKVMALNKLSIDKVDLTNKRILIRYLHEYVFLIHFLISS